MCSNIREMPIGFPGWGMAEMYFINRNFDGSHRIRQGYGGMRQSTRIQKHKVYAGVASLQGVDQNAFVITLHIFDAVLRKFLLQIFENCIHTGMAVNFGFSLAQQIQVRAVEDQHMNKIHETKGRS